MQDANQELDNLIFIAFMLDFVTRRLSYRSAEEIKSRYYRWLIKCPSSLQEIDCIVDP